MLPRRDYDFSEMENCMYTLRNNHSAGVLNDLKRELNKFFKDSKCLDILYTENTDKMFFGMQVMPRLTGNDAVRIAQSDEKFRIEEYYIEMDSKLFNPVLGLNSRELVAVLLHEVGHMVNDSTPVEELRKYLDQYLAQNDEVLVISDSIHYRELLAYGFKETLRNICSAFKGNIGEEEMADQFVIIYGYGADLCTAFDKIQKNMSSLNATNADKMSTLIWTMRLYKDIKHRRIAALKTMKKGKSLTPSIIEKKELTMLVKRLERIDDEALITEGTIDDMKNRYNNSLKELKYHGIRGIEDDYYEYSVRLNNIDNEDDALLLLRQLNSKLSILDDYLETEDLSDKEKDRWYALMRKLEDIRNKLKDQQFDKSRYYSAVVVNYPEINMK